MIDSFVAQQFRHVAVRNLLGETFRDRGLADARFTDQDRIVFRSPAKHLNDALDFIAATDHRIKLVLFRQVSQITTKRAERRGFDIFLGRLTAFLGFRRCEIRIEFFENLVARPLDIDFETLENTRGDAFAFAQKPKQNVFGADVGMIERFGFLAGEGEHFFTRGVYGIFPTIFVSGPEPTCFSTSMRTVSRSSPIFCRTFTATPCPSLISPSSRCSVPT